MAKLLPVNSTHAELPVRTKLDGIFFWLRLVWNVRESIWTFGISDSDDAALAHGLAVRVETDMLRGIRGQVGLPPGAIVPIDTSGSQTDPGRDDLGDRVRLVYLTQAEVADAS